MFIFNILFSICLASFGGVVALRVPQHKSIIWGHSHCDYCQHQLAWYQMLPIISYLCLHGRCAYCKQPIKPVIFLIEITGLIAGIEASHQQLVNPYVLIIFIITLAVCAITDWYYLAIWPVILLPSFISILLTTSFAASDGWEWLFFNLTLLILYFCQRQKLGWGDLEILALMSLFLKLKITLEVIIIATSLIVIKIIFSKKRLDSLKVAIPLVPYLLIALLVRLAFI